MRRTGIIFSLMAALAITAACSRSAEQREARQEAALEVGGRSSGDEITVTGCLTAASDGGAYALTAARDALASSTLQVGSGEVPTYTYELVGHAADLFQHVGQQVEVRGHLDEDRKDKAKVDQEEETKLEPRQSAKDVVTPAIETEIEAVINVRRLEVSTVTPTGQACLATGR